MTKGLILLWERGCSLINARGWRAMGDDGGGERVI